MPIDRDLLEQLRKVASASQVPLGRMSMDEIAASLGMTRMTLYRKAGSRSQIEAALGAVGVDVRGRPTVHDRVVAAAAELLREQPIAGVTLEVIAARAGCSLPAIHARFGGRQGVLKAVIERYSPLIPVRSVVATEMADGSADLRHDIRLLYTTVFTGLQDEWPVLRSFVAEVLRDPASDIGKAFREWYLPQITAVLSSLFNHHIARGTMRSIPLPIVGQMLIGPLALHVSSRQYLADHMGFNPPDAATTIELFTDMFCRAVGTENGR